MARKVRSERRRAKLSAVRIWGQPAAAVTSFSSLVRVHNELVTRRVSSPSSTDLLRSTYPSADPPVRRGDEQENSGTDARIRTRPTTTRPNRLLGRRGLVGIA